MKLSNKIKEMLSKKYDVGKDRLRTVFDPTQRQYNFHHGNTIIPFESLNRKTRKILKQKNSLLISNPTLLEKELETVKIKKRLEQLKSIGYPCHSFEYLGEAKGTMSNKMEELLTKLTTEEHILLGIHRVKESTPDEAIDDILTNGLKMTGHFDGSIPNNSELQNNVSYYVDNKIIIKELMYADQYKNSKGSILIRIPDEDLLGNIYIVDKNGEIRLNPNYIVGYIPLYDNHHLENIILPAIQSHENSYSYNNSSSEKNFIYNNSQIRNSSKHR